MSKPMPAADEIARLQRASEWVQRLNESNDQALAGQWMEWCGSDSRNLPAFEQMQSLWDGFAESRGATLYPHQSAPLAARPQHRSGLIKLAASVVLLVGIAAWLFVRYTQIQAYDTAIGEQRRITMADGSQIDLAPDSRVSAHFTLARRDVQLEHGQAFFAVAHSRMRPFIVHVNGLTVTAVGTAFDVRIGPSNTVVTVSEGRVNVASGTKQAAGGPNLAPATIRAGVGQRVTYSKPALGFSVASVDPKLAGSWRHGILQFVGEPLEDVADEVNRYSARRIVVAPEFQQTRFTGTVSPANVRDWLQALEQIYSVQVLDRGADGVLIRSRVHNDARE